MNVEVSDGWISGISAVYDHCSEPRTIFMGYRGSKAHGMLVPHDDPESIDDVDLIGVFVGPEQHYLGFGRKDTREKTMKAPQSGVLFDAVNYELVKFIRLAVKSNPNILGNLWLPPQHTIVTSDIWQALVDARSTVFSSKLAYKTFGGYAKAHLEKMTRHQMNPEKSSEITFIESELLRIEHGEKRCYCKDWDQKKLHQRLNHLNGYMGTKRRENVRKFGYDTKNAAHLIRLLYMGIEFLLEGEIYLDRSQPPVEDAEFLLSIKRGEHSLEDVQGVARQLFKALDRAYEKSSLPDAPREAEAEALAVKCIKRFYAEKWERQRGERIFDEMYQTYNRMGRDL